MKGRPLPNQVVLTYKHYDFMGITGDRDQYAAGLKETLDKVTRSVVVKTGPRLAEETGGPGVEFDAVRVFIDVVGTYAAMRVIASDLDALIHMLTGLGRDPVHIDSFTAEWRAIDYAATPGNFADIELIETIPMWRPKAWVDEESPWGFAVRLTVDGTARIVVVRSDGTIESADTGLHGVDDDEDEDDDD